jgi:hypothetical protein
VQVDRAEGQDVAAHHQAALAGEEPGVRAFRLLLISHHRDRHGTVREARDLRPVVSQRLPGARRELGDASRVPSRAGGDEGQVVGRGGNEHGYPGTLEHFLGDLAGPARADQQGAANARVVRVHVEQPEYLKPLPCLLEAPHRGVEASPDGQPGHAPPLMLDTLQAQPQPPDLHVTLGGQPVGLRDREPLGRQPDEHGPSDDGVHGQVVPLTRLDEIRADLLQLRVTRGTQEGEQARAERETEQPGIADPACHGDRLGREAVAQRVLDGVVELHSQGAEQPASQLGVLLGNRAQRGLQAPDELQLDLVVRLHDP